MNLHLLSELLEVEAANGQTVPYTGFIEIDITFPRYCFGSEITVTTLALVVSETLLVGTNTLNSVYKSCAMTDTVPQISAPFLTKSLLPS